MAAISVAFYHFMDDAARNGAAPSHALSAIRGFLPWDAGVDIFFVISGFVIVHASARLFATGWASLRLFIARRLARIVPLYWMMTAAFLAVLLAGRSAIHGDIGGPGYILASFLFIPWPRPDGVMQPAFGLGWTLNYEMFFYAVFTPCLLLARRYAIPACTAIICGFILLGLRLHPASPQLAFWCNPLVLEFCAGMILAQLLAAGLRLPTALRLALPLLAIALLHVFGHGPGQWRVLSQGLPALLLAAAAALARPPATLSPLARLLVRLGDASYAMYLVHPFVMRGFSILWHKFHGHSAVGVTIYVIAGLAVSQLAALLIHARLERKITARLRGKSGVVDETIQMSGMRSDRLL